MGQFKKKRMTPLAQLELEEEAMESSFRASQLAKQAAEEVRRRESGKEANNGDNFELEVDSFTAVEATGAHTFSKSEDELKRTTDLFCTSKDSDIATEDSECISTEHPSNNLQMEDPDEVDIFLIN